MHEGLFIETKVQRIQFSCENLELKVCGMEMKNFSVIFINHLFFEIYLYI